MAQIEFNDESFWKTVRKFGSKVPFALDAVAMFYALRDSSTSLRDKAIIGGALLYWIDPFDLVPDFIISAGQLDDLTIVIAALAKVRSSVTETHRAKARAMLGLPEPTKSEPHEEQS